MTNDNWRRLQILIPGLLLALFVFSSQVSGNAVALSSSGERFAMRLASNLGLKLPRSNVAVSPLLLQSALTLLYAGVTPDSSTAGHLRVALDLQYLGTPEQAVDKFRQLIGELRQSTAIGCQVRLLSEFYTQNRYTFNYRDEFEARAVGLGIGVHRLDFDNALSVAQNINYEFQTRSNYSVGELVSKALVEAASASDTPFFHVSALTFRAPWAQQFDSKQTQRINFFSDAQTHKLVEAMFVQHRFKYAELPGLDACVVELPYAKAELSLLIIYPNQLEGLSALESQLQGLDLQQLRSRLSERKLALTLPKFNLLAHTELRHILEQLGLGQLFTEEAQLHNVFSSIFSGSAPHLTAVPHAALLEVLENGGETSQTFVASFTDLFRSTLSLVINHPFFYAIGNDKATLLAGHVVEI